MKYTQHEEDLIPDPELDGHLTNDVVIRFINAVSKSVADSNEGFRQMAHQMDTLATSVETLVKSETKRELDNNNIRNDIERLDQSNMDRKEDVKEAKRLAVKALGQIDTLENTFNNSCSLTSQIIKKELTEDIDKEVGNIRSHVKLSWIIFSVMGLALLSVSGLLISSTLSTYKHNIEVNTKLSQSIVKTLQDMKLTDSKTYQSLQLHIQTTIPNKH